jgi:hypothetical protein
VLEPSQKLVGDAQSAPVISTTGAEPAVTLANGADVQRVDLRTAGGPAIYGSGINAATVAASSSASGVALDGGAGNVTIAAAIAGVGGRAVSIQNRTGGTVSLTGAVSDTGTGVELRNNTGATISLTGRLTVPSFSATGGGTVTATGVGSTLSGPALEVRNTTLGAFGLRFQTVTADSIVLSGTGTSGGLAINGSATVGPISLTNTSKVSLTGVHATAITGTGVHGFTLMDSTVSSGVVLGEVDGAVTVMHNTAAGGIGIENTGGTISGLAMANNASDSIRLALSGSASLAAGSVRANDVGAISLVGNGTFGTFTGQPGAGIDIVSVDHNTLTGPLTATVSRGNLAISGNTTPRIAVDATGTGPAAFDVAGNTVGGPLGIGLTTGAGPVVADVNANVLGGAAPISVQAGASTQVRVGGNALATGDVQVAGDPLCADVAANVAARVLLSTSHGFGIAGLFPDPATAAEARAFVASANPGAATVTATGPQFTGCALSF